MNLGNELTGKTFLITGASSGLGQDISIRLSSLGGKVLLVGRDEARLRQTAEMCVGGEVKLEPFDLSQVDLIPNWMKEVSERHGLIDGLVHSAGTVTVRPLKIFRYSDFESMMRINVGAALALVRGFRAPKVRAQDARIVFLSSVSGLVGQSALSVYCATKGALISMTRSLAMELSRENIKINCIAPGWIRSHMTEREDSPISKDQAAKVASEHPLGIGLPEDVSDLVAFMLSPDSAWTTGTTFVADGGFTAI
jgi:NAD(P)-dependent dehydrogenase (short-subunit alcohol dehydrogenase family)